MKVNELIKVLITLNQDAEVVVWSEEMGIEGWPILHVGADNPDSKVIIALD
jgi:hypothetical protein